MMPSPAKDDRMLDDKFRADLCRLVTDFRQDGGGLLVAIAALDGLSDDLYAETCPGQDSWLEDDEELEG
jgi:hypothetical protein